MRFDQLTRRVVTLVATLAATLLLFYLCVYYLITTGAAPVKSPPEAALALTALFFLFSFAGALLTVIFLVRDFLKKEKLLNEVKDLSSMVMEGNFHEKIFFEDYPDLSEVYRSLNRIIVNLRDKFDQMEKETSQLNTIIESIPDALIILNNEKDIVFCNERARELFDNKSGMVNRPLIEVIRSVELMETLDRVVKFDKSELIDILLEKTVEKYLQVRMSPYYRKNDLIGVVILFHDITELKKLESMRKDFLANVTHEIKTPVTAITGYAETLLDGAISDKDNAFKFLSIIKFHGERLNRLVDDLMTISKIELGVTKICKAREDISLIMDSVLETLQGKAQQKGIYLRKSMEAAPLIVNADRDKLYQVLLNLVDNAIKFTMAGGVEIGVKNVFGRTCIYVADTGVGVPKRFISRLGERFFRIDPSRSRQLGGTGLGLAIVKHIVKAHNWELKIESEEGKGTHVKIYIV